jgi:hypothetical protein
MTRSEWDPYKESSYEHVRYSPEGKAYEVRIVGTDRVSNLHDASNFIYTTMKSNNPFNLEFEVRKVKNYTPPKPKVPDEKSREEVLSEFYDRDTGVLLEMEREFRYVYKNSKGRYIKTRGSGRTFLTSDNPAYIRYMRRGYRDTPVSAVEYEQALTQTT